MKKKTTVHLVLILIMALLCVPLTGCHQVYRDGDVTADVGKYRHKGEAGKEETTGTDTEKHPEETTDAPVTTAPPETTAAPVTTAPPETTTPPETAPPTTEPAPETGKYVSEPSAFANTLFIGDSRTVGITMYGAIGSADVFASVGLNTFRLFTETINGQTLEGLLSSKKYDKILIMLGINEIGYDIGAIANQYSSAVSRIVKLQPGATVFIEANLHIKTSRSNYDTVFNNGRLNDLNNRIKAIANGQNIKYIDVNPLFDDSTGGLNEQCASDDFHPYAAYYIEWCNWIAESIK